MKRITWRQAPPPPDLEHRSLWSSREWQTACSSSEDDDIDGGGGQPLNVNDFHESHYLNLLICRCSMILNSVRYIEEFFVTGQQKKCFPGQSFSIIAKRLSTLSFSKMAHPVFRSCWSNLWANSSDKQVLLMLRMILVLLNLLLVLMLLVVAKLLELSSVLPHWSPIKLLAVSPA